MNVFAIKRQRVRQFAHWRMPRDFAFGPFSFITLLLVFGAGLAVELTRQGMAARHLAYGAAAVLGAAALIGAVPTWATVAVAELALWIAYATYPEVGSLLLAAIVSAGLLAAPLYVALGSEFSGRFLQFDHLRRFFVAQNELGGNHPFYFYVPADKQVMVSEQDQGRSLAARLLYGKGGLADEFAASLDEPLEEGVVRLRLVPRREQPEITQAFVDVEPSGRIRALGLQTGSALTSLVDV